MLISIKRILLPVVGMAVSLSPQASYAQLSPNATVVASGLEGPRGLRFGPDGDLYVAEAGLGGTNATTGCMQVPSPVGPYTGGLTAGFRSSIGIGRGRPWRWGSRPPRTGWDSSRDLPISNSSMGPSMRCRPAADVRTATRALPDGVTAVNRFTGNWHYVADISAFMMAKPVQYPNADDFEPDGTPYSMIPRREHCMWSSRIQAKCFGWTPIAAISSGRSMYRLRRGILFLRRWPTTTARSCSAI